MHLHIVGDIEGVQSLEHEPGSEGFCGQLNNVRGISVTNYTGQRTSGSSQEWLQRVAKVIADGDFDQLFPLIEQAAHELELESRKLEETVLLMRRLGDQYRALEPLARPTSRLETAGQAAPAPPTRVETLARVTPAPEGRERGATIREAALALVRRGVTTVTSRDVITELAARGVTLDVKRPASVIGTVLSRMPGFVRGSKDLYRFTAAESDTRPT